MATYRLNNELLPDKRSITGRLLKTHDRSKHGVLSVRRGAKLCRISIRRLLFWTFSVAMLICIYLAVFGLKVPHGKKKHGISSIEEEFDEFFRSDVSKQPKGNPHRPRFSSCHVDFWGSVNYLIEPNDYANITQFSLGYVDTEENPLGHDPSEPRFGGHQTLEERENSFYARNQTIHCGFVKESDGFPSNGFDLNEKDKKYVKSCRVVVSSCIFGSSDFLRRPTSKLISEYSKENVCFVMFVDELSLLKLSSEGNAPDEKGRIGLWRIVVVRDLPYNDMRKTGKDSIWLDSKLRLVTDPMLIIEYFFWRTGSEYAISNHYTRHGVWEEVLQNKRLNKYNHTAIDEQFNFYQSDGLRKFDPSDPNSLLPSYVPEGSFIIRAHTPMSNLFSCLWFNEVDRFTSRDQLSFAYTFLKLKRMNPDNLNMFKDCQRRALAKLFHHRVLSPDTPPPPL